MKIFYRIVAVFILFNSFQTAIVGQNTKGGNQFNDVKIDTLFQDNSSIRAIVVDANKIWYAANRSKFGYYDLDKNEKKESLIQGDSLNLEFRSIAQNVKNIFFINVGNPAFLYKIDKASLQPTIVYEENHEKVFYDSMQFWNTNEGIAMGDPTNNVLSIIITRDGGLTWNKLPADILPKVVAGEAAFAASNTNIIIKRDHTWIVSGGVKSRVFYSPDKGLSWTVYETPIVQGQAMTGIFTADFYDAKIGFIAGGDYTKLQQNFGNKAITSDGGKTWQLIAENEGFGYASCVQYVPKSDGKGLVSVGASGLFYSSDSGSTWKQLAKDTSLYTLRFIDNHTAIAAGKNKMIRIQFLK
ncbi:exo-alpha-sialidase [Flavobacterium sp. F-380]|uniref:Exo-alpha-sialidase n=1 Tax=Flavobacterium kayseriense TaxID=2764714 RepID=A0ABR7J921_9FLAO|nr:sialidase family protein [Flavobacterium kayseriense]MBC5842039.1 exo-alpha-sialidase [Flavobacterium kayseriense]MBC5848569.1 exo-alpha-sialidase [Flavobacterium kayseriense]